MHEPLGYVATAYFCLFLRMVFSMASRALFKAPQAVFVNYSGWQPLSK